MSTADRRPAERRLPEGPVADWPGMSRVRMLGGIARAAAKRAPLVGRSLEFTERELSRVEGLVWREVRSRIDAAAGPAEEQSGAGPYRHRHAEPRDLLATLLTDSIEQSAQQARERLFAALIGALQPDEARILAALSDGTEYPLIHVASRGALGAAGPVLMENASTVGRAAGVALPDWVPHFVTHLQQLQLVSIGPESPGLADGYEILLTESVVRQAQVDAGGHVRIIRRSLRLSSLGRELWDACSAPSRPTSSLPTDA